jgi:hypothetical protein
MFLPAKFRTSKGAVSIKKGHTLCAGERVYRLPILPAQVLEKKIDIRAGVEFLRDFRRIVVRDCRLTFDGTNMKMQIRQPFSEV